MEWNGRLPSFKQKGRVEPVPRNGLPPLQISNNPLLITSHSSHKYSSDCAIRYGLGPVPTSMVGAWTTVTTGTSPAPVYFFKCQQSWQRCLSHPCGIGWKVKHKKCVKRYARRTTVQTFAKGCHPKKLQVILTRRKWAMKYSKISFTIKQTIMAHLSLFSLRFGIWFDAINIRDFIISFENDAAKKYWWL